SPQPPVPNWGGPGRLADFPMANKGRPGARPVVLGRDRGAARRAASPGGRARELAGFPRGARGAAPGGAEGRGLPPTHPFEEPVPARPVEMHEGPVMVTIEYVIDPTRAHEFEALMAETRGSRLRHGAVSWGMFEDVQQPGRFIEYFACDTWADYLRR